LKDPGSESFRVFYFVAGTSLKPSLSLFVEPNFVLDSIPEKRERMSQWQIIRVDLGDDRSLFAVQDVAEWVQGLLGLKGRLASQFTQVLGKSKSQISGIANS
jgi:hypothetical protein